MRVNLIGAYHLNHPQLLRGVCGAPCVQRDGYALCAEDVYSSADLLAFAVGRIRNAAALAEALDLAPDVPQSSLVAAAYARWGVDYPAHIEGPAATGVFDRQADALVLSRDRIGECPLFYCRSGSTFAFADHPDLLLRAGQLKPVVDARGLAELFALGPARTPGRTPYRDLYALEPGCQLTVRGAQTDIRRYYALPVRPHTDDAEATVRRVRVLLEQAVADVLPLKPAAMLSGGLDSTALTALMRAQGADVKSFSVDYAQNERYFQASAFQPERDAPYIAEAVEALGTDHMRVLLSQQALAEGLGAAVDARGFPGMADIDSSLLLFSREIAPYARYVVSGECGDEVFGGYPWFKDADTLREDAFPWSGSVALRESILRAELRGKVDIPGYVRETLAQAVARAGALPGEAGDEARLRTMQQLCFQFFMANLQERAVCMGAACGLNVLTPFSDERLLAYVFNVPWTVKFMGGQEKGLLRAAVRDLLPERLLRRRKSPYPKTCSPEYTQIILRLAAELLADASAPLWQIVDREAVENIAASELSPLETPWFGQLMAGPQMLAYLLQVNDWMRSRGVIVEI